MVFLVRHHLGAIQIEARLYDDAIGTYKEDLKRLPKNRWVLHSLKLAYEKLGESTKVKYTEERLLASSATTDIELTTSRIK